MKTTKITIGRLFNLGSYEHVRYEITVEIHEGESASNALIGLEKILSALNPKEPGNVPTEDDLKRELRRLESMQALDDDSFERVHGGYVGTRLEYMDRISVSLAEAAARRKAWQEKAEKARALLDDLGGAAKWTDAKLNWEDGGY